MQLSGAQNLVSVNWPYFLIAASVLLLLVAMATFAWKHFGQCKKIRSQTSQQNGPIVLPSAEDMEAPEQDEEFLLANGRLVLVSDY